MYLRQVLLLHLLSLVLWDIGALYLQVKTRAIDVLEVHMVAEQTWLTQSAQVYVGLGVFAPKALLNSVRALAQPDIIV